MSRAAAGKYLDTPTGVIPLRELMPHALHGDETHGQAWRALQERIRILIESEDPRRPLSDQKLADLLNHERGARIARRTVTKYRERLGIPSTRERRRRE